MSRISFSQVGLPQPTRSFSADVNLSGISANIYYTLLDVTSGSGILGVVRIRTGDFSWKATLKITVDGVENILTPSTSAIYIRETRYGFEWIIKSVFSKSLKLEAQVSGGNIIQSAVDYSLD